MFKKGMGEWLCTSWFRFIVYYRFWSAVTGMFCSWGFLFGVHIDSLFLLAQDLTSNQYHN